ncbi:MAG: hypothetical protein AAF389_11115 [Gemmatimonadota bacterium]
MPKNKDLKRLVRARMAKTGESYTAARAHFVSPTGGQFTPGNLPEAHEKLAGMSDDAVRNATGKSWPEWATYLDDRDAYTWEHPDIAAHLDTSFEFGGWWAQTVTVGYERFRGLRDFGQRRGGGYDVNKSRTVAVSVSRLWEAFERAETRAAWMSETVVDFHKQTPTKSMRGSLPDGTKVDLYFTDKGAAKASVSIQHRGLSDRAAADASRARWGAELDRLVDHLTTG